MKRVLFINIYPNTIAKYSLAAYILKAVALKDPYLQSKVAIDIVNLPETLSQDEMKSILEEYMCFDIFCYSVYCWNIDKINLLNLHMSRNKTGIFGGPEIDSIMMQHAKNSSNYYIIGQGENKFVSLLYYILSNPERDIETKIWDDGSNGQQVDFVKVYAENIVPSNLYRRKIAYLETQRGCFFQCSYCNYSKNESKIKYFDTNEVLKELDYIIDIGVKEIRFTDPVFTSDISRAGIFY